MSINVASEHFPAFHNPLGFLSGQAIEHQQPGERLLSVPKRTVLRAITGLGCRQRLNLCGGGPSSDAA